MDIVDAYLQRLELDAEEPSAEGLARLHRAHVERVPYETTWIALDERWGIDPEQSVERIALRGRGGYCFHLNGSLSWLLERLGYHVSRHIGGVHFDNDPAEAMTNHLVLLVRDLPSEDNPGGAWYVDAGLGDALHEPLPLASGSYRQGPMTFTLDHTPGAAGDWHLSHDPAGTFTGMYFRETPTGMDAFADRHVVLSTSPESGFVRVPAVMRRHAAGVSALRGLTLSERDAEGTSTRVIEDRAEWFDVIGDHLGLRLDGTTAASRQRLWARVQEAHRTFLAAP